MCSLQAQKQGSSSQNSVHPTTAAKKEYKHDVIIQRSPRAAGLPAWHAFGPTAFGMSPDSSQIATLDSRLRERQSCRGGARGAQDGPDGAHPFGGVTLVNGDKHLVGIAGAGGANGAGTIFRMQL